MNSINRMPQQQVHAPVASSETLGDRIDQVRRFLRQNPLAALGLGMVLVILLGSILAPILTPYGPILIDIKHKLEAPSLQHPLGTDFFGRDVLSRILHGGRNTLSIGMLVIGLAFVVGVPIGLDLRLCRGCSGLADHAGGGCNALLPARWCWPSRWPPPWVPA